MLLSVINVVCHCDHSSLHFFVVWVGYSVYYPFVLHWFVFFCLHDILLVRFAAYVILSYGASVGRLLCDVFRFYTFGIVNKQDLRDVTNCESAWDVPICCLSKTGDYFYNVLVELFSLFILDSVLFFQILALSLRKRVVLILLLLFCFLFCVLF